MNRDLPLRNKTGKLSDRLIHRNRNLRGVSPTLDPEHLDELASREAMRARGAGWRTDFGPRRNALRRFLDHRVGRKWSEVHSEVSHAFGARGREALEREVLMHTYLDDNGAVVVNDTPWCGAPLADIYGRHLYVDPVSGTLREARREYPWLPLFSKARDNGIEIDGTIYFRRGGAWFSTRRADVVALTRKHLDHHRVSFHQAYLHVARRMSGLPRLVIHGKHVLCDPDFTRQLSARRVARIGLDVVDVEEADCRRPSKRARG